MFRIAFKLLYLTGCLVDIGKEAAGRFAVEASGGNECVMSLFALRPGLGIELDPVIPALLGWKRGQMNATGSGIEGFTASFSLIAGCMNTLPGFLRVHSPNLEFAVL